MAIRRRFATFPPVAGFVLSVAFNNWDTIIVGGGAAGLMAAASAAQRGKQVLLLEKNKKIGVKILMSGGTRCNITHDCGAEGIVEAFGKNGKFLYSALASLSPADVVAQIEAQGVPTKIESTGKIFPVSNKAIDVRDALSKLAADSGAVILPACSVVGIERREEGIDRFVVSTEKGEFTSKAVIITCGGKSYPGCGTTGDGYAWAEHFGHSIVATVPALTPVLSNCHWAHELKGITIDHVRVRVNQSPAANTDVNSIGGKSQKQPKAQTIAERIGSFLFTHWGFSGPAVLDVSREIARHPEVKTLELVCDFLPLESREQLTQHLSKRRSNEGKQLVGNLLTEFFPKRFANAMIQNSGVDPAKRNADLSRRDLMSFVEHIKSARFPIKGTLGFEKAEVTAGGVELKEVDSKTMQSKLVDGLFFAGEILDLDGRIGGFNFKSAFSTGWLAGQWV